MTTKKATKTPAKKKPTLRTSYAVRKIRGTGRTTTALRGLPVSIPKATRLSPLLRDVIAHLDKARGSAKINKIRRVREKDGKYTIVLGLIEPFGEAQLNNKAKNTGIVQRMERYAKKASYLGYKIVEVNSKLPSTNKYAKKGHDLYFAITVEAMKKVPKGVAGDKARKKEKETSLSDVSPKRRKNKPVAKKTNASKVVAKKEATKKKPVAKKPVAKKPVAKKTATAEDVMGATRDAIAGKVTPIVLIQTAFEHISSQKGGDDTGIDDIIKFVKNVMPDL